MSAPSRKIAFMIAATDHGTLIVNRFDYNSSSPDQPHYGVGIQLLDMSSYALAEINLTLQLLDLRRKHYGNDVVAVDCGSNIGTHTVEWAKHMTEWGSVLAIEAQERIYYALAGNIALNNCFNARVMNAAVSARSGVMKIPAPNYSSPASFGSLELKKRDNTEFIGQKIDYSEKSMVDIRTISVDDLALARVDLIKIDVEGMELDVLEGSVNCIAKNHPILVVEWVKNEKGRLKSFLDEVRYKVFEHGMNLVAIHETDKGLREIKA